MSKAPSSFLIRKKVKIHECSNGDAVANSHWEVSAGSTFGDDVDERVFPREPTKDVLICTYDYD